MTSQIPTFGRTVAEQMADYRERIAARIRREMDLKGENEVDVAAAIGTTPRTVERWVAAKTEPQKRYRKPLADHLEVPMEELYPDLEAEERAVLDQLNRMEARLDAIAQAVAQLLSQQGGDLGPELGDLRQELLAVSPSREADRDQAPPGSSRARTPA